MFALCCSNPFHSMRFSSVTKQCLFLLKKFSCSDHHFSFCNNFCYCSSSRLSEDAIASFKNPSLAHFLNNFVDGKIATSIPHFCQNQKKQANLITLIKQFNASKNNISSLQELKKDTKDDSDFSKSIEEEITSQEKCLSDVEETMLNEILSNDDESISDIIVEVSAGVGGQEAMLFAHELHSLYHNYFNFRGWQFELANFEETELGGLRHSIIMLSAANSYKILNLEAGVHRVQRIPVTEKYSRLQTSTVTVTVYPQPSEVDIVIPPSDLRIETKTSRGPGGQHANKIQTAIRLHHLPTGIIVECQTHRSQTQNRKLAMQRLRSKLFQRECEKRDTKIDGVRKYQMGLKGRNEKIRTYNFMQDRITDHRYYISVNNVNRYFDGTSHFHNFLEQLLEAQNVKRREEFLRAIQASKL